MAKTNRSKIDAPGVGQIKFTIDLLGDVESTLKFPMVPTEAKEFTTIFARVVVQEQRLYERRIQLDLNLRALRAKTDAIIREEWGETYKLTENGVSERVSADQEVQRLSSELRTAENQLRWATNCLSILRLKYERHLEYVTKHTDLFTNSKG